jgi:DNA excision repair protein ERCC-2
MRDALRCEEITRPVLEEVSRQHQVCPFELSLDVSGWVDAVICDYNYVFDPQAYLRRHFDAESSNHGFLVDEAHNLVDRAREMFSAELDDREIIEVRRALRQAVPRCANSLGRLSRALRKLAGPEPGATEAFATKESTTELDLFAPAPAQAGAAEDRPAHGTPFPFRAARDGVRTSLALPADLLPLLDQALTTAESWLARNQPAAFRQDLLDLYFRLGSFRRTAELYDERYVTILGASPAVRVRWFCRDPSHLLRQALERGKAAVFFSATLTPLDYYRALLGGSPEDPWLQLPCPFPPEHLAVLVQDRLRTQLKARAESLAEVVRAIAQLVQGRRGNYLVYLPSYQYLGIVQEQFHALHPAVPVLVQRPGMTEAEREAFLAAFAVEHAETRVGFVVLGGIFGEGIDLVGERLIGAVIVGVGLPQLCVERDLIRDFFQTRAGAGFDYAYTFPGMNRVLQAMGRVIRSESDRGVVLLIDARYAEGRYRRLFPGHWQPVRVASLAAIGDALRRFWEPGTCNAPTRVL